MIEQEAIETLQDIHDVAEYRIKNGDNRGVVYIPKEKLFAFDMAIKALERNQPKQVTDIRGDKLRFGKCPSCGRRISTVEGGNYCQNCGQRLEW